MSVKRGTFSILAKDGKVLGAASASGSVGVGERVIHARPKVGVVVTQGYTNISYGPRGLELMASGQTPKNTLLRLLNEDSERELRQVALINIKGEIVTHTGARVPMHRGQVIGEGFAVIGNLLSRKEVLSTMATRFEECEGDLAVRMVEALKAGHGYGGDMRGERSAALVVVDSEKVRIRLDVRDNSSPIKELEKLLSSSQKHDKNVLLI
jgi:uncharacterized Ntn-hydrolase superfamily protein